METSSYIRTEFTRILFIYFWLHHTTCGVSLPSPRIEYKWMKPSANWEVIIQILWQAKRYTQNLLWDESSKRKRLRLDFGSMVLLTFVSILPGYNLQMGFILNWLLNITEYSNTTRELISEGKSSILYDTKMNYFLSKT